MFICLLDSFQELKEVRVAFQLYEHEDMLGLVVDQHLLMRTLKVGLVMFRLWWPLLTFNVK